MSANDSPFGGDRLPSINAIQAIKNATILFTESDIADKLNEFQPEHAEASDSGCRVVWRQPNGGDGLGPGETVRILGYRTFVGHYTVKRADRTLEYPQQLLFAMVLVKD